MDKRSRKVQTAEERTLRKREVSWILYDCGVSAYSMAVTTALFPIFFGMFSGDAMQLGYWNSLASIIIALLSPVLGTIADYKDYKKRFFLSFAGLGIVMTLLLAFVPQGQWIPLIVVYVLSEVGAAGANIFYDSFLTDATVDERMDQVSARGFAFGYIASIIPFGISMAIVYAMGMERMGGYRVAFIITALWWAAFTVPMVKNIKQRFYVEPEPNPIGNSFRRLGRTFLNIRHYKYIVIFLLAYFFYIDGVGTIIKMAVPYVQNVLGPEVLSAVDMLIILLIVQIVAFPFALIYGELGKRFGNLVMIRVGILTYLVTVFLAYNMSHKNHVFLLGMFIGMAQGGIQALSRSYFARIVPKEQSNEFFGFYNIFGKFAAIMGPFIMSLVTDLTGNARNSILAILPLFIIGFILTLFLPRQDNGSRAPALEEVE